jgi:hypothetical protein
LDVLVPEVLERPRPAMEQDGFGADRDFSPMARPIEELA